MVADTLEIQIKTEASKTNKELDSMINKLNILQKSLRGTTQNINFSKMTNGLKSTTSSIVNTSNGFQKANSNARNLAVSFTRMYASIRVLKSAFNGMKDAVKESSDYLEDLNYFTSAFSQVAENADLSVWSELGYSSAEEYYKSFSERAKELTAKMTGFYPEDNGLLTNTKSASLGMNPSDLMQYQAMFGQMASSMGMTSENALKLSNALTMIGADLASVRNMDFESVWQNLASGIVGGTRAIDKYGVNIRNVNLQQKLYELGIDASIQSLNQQDKALLRGIVILESTKYAWADLSKTINTPANQFRLFTANMQNLARTIGNLFLPAISKVMPYINGLAIALQRLFAWVGSLLGIDFSNITGGFKGIDNSGISDLLDDSEGLSDNFENAQKAASKLRKQLQGFDKLNVISDQKENEKGNNFEIPSLNSILGNTFDGIYDEYMKEWQKAFEEMENKAQGIADKIQAFAKSVWDFIEPLRNAISELWDGGLSKFANFTWTALKDFYENFLVPIGTWAFGTEGKGLPKFLDTVNELLIGINWEGLSASLKDLWDSLEPFAEKVGDGLNWFFENVVVPSSQYVINEILIDSIDKLADVIDIANIIFDKAAPVFQTFWDNLGKDWNANIFREIKESISTLLTPFESLKNLLADFSWGNFLDYAKDVAKFAELISNPFGAIGFGDKIMGNSLATTTKEKISDLIDFEGLKEKVSEVFESMKEKISNVFTSIKEFFEPLIETIKGFGTRLGQIFEGISIIAQAVFIKVGGFINEKVIEPVWSKFSAFFEKIKNGFTILLNAIKSIWENVSGWFDKTVIEPFKKAWTIATTSVKIAFEVMGTAIKNSITSSINNMLSKIEGGINYAIDGINAILEGFNELVDWGAKVVGVEWGGVNLIPKISVPKIPQYFMGGFPEDGLFFANHNELVGRFTNGQTAVANNEQIVSGIEQGVQRAVERTLANYLANIERNTKEIANKDFGITERQVANAVQNQNRQHLMRTGQPLLAT